MIVETFGVAGVPVREFVVAGGLLKNRRLMQLYADVLRLPISTIGSEQGPALGSAIHAAVAAGAYPDVRAASEAMGRVERAVYTPDAARGRTCTTGSTRSTDCSTTTSVAAATTSMKRLKAVATGGDRMSAFDDTYRRGASGRPASRSARCTPNSPATDSSCGRPATSAPACREPTAS